MKTARTGKVVGCGGGGGERPVNTPHSTGLFRPPVKPQQRAQTTCTLLDAQNTATSLQSAKWQIRAFTQPGHAPPGPPCKTTETMPKNTQPLREYKTLRGLLSNCSLMYCLLHHDSGHTRRCHHHLSGRKTKQTPLTLCCVSTLVTLSSLCNI